MHKIIMTCNNYVGIQVWLISALLFIDSVCTWIIVLACIYTLNKNSLEAVKKGRSQVK